MIQTRQRSLSAAVGLINADNERTRLDGRRIPIRSRIRKTTAFNWLILFLVWRRTSIQWPEDPTDVKVGLEDSIAATGLLHVLNNASNRSLGMNHAQWSQCRMMPSISGAMDGLEDVCNVLSHEQSRERLICTCFQGPVAARCTQKIGRFWRLITVMRWRQRMESIRVCICTVQDWGLLLKVSPSIFDPGIGVYRCASG